ncbi:hypothetical protein [Bradyrhizobium sp. SZCCHNR1070]|uniref:hypothetical protein n=1 Tax=Bradyrhizobium sp. SZCCHNR1070 TaxID=3057361 RepID=UPI002915FA22|nr:hypothetical protein [Bradyrhizobium sp. SZCCHNR1070]
MRKLGLGMLVGAILTAGCSEPSAKLSKDEQQLLDAVMFLFTGLEDNTKVGSGPETWRREVKERTVEFSTIRENKGIGFSDEETNRKIRQSAYVREVEKISLIDPCTFHIEILTEFSRGSSRDDFGAYSSKSMNSAVFYLANASRFLLDVEDAQHTRALIELAGPRVVCTDSGYCDNGWNSFEWGLDRGRFSGEEIENGRRQRALEFIQSKCPGRPF